MTDQWNIDPSHPFDSIGYIKEEKSGLFGKKKGTLIIHETWLKYVKDHIDKPDVAKILKQVAEQQQERFDMKTNKKNSFYGDEAGFEQYCRIKYNELYEHIKRMIDDLIAKRG